MVRQLIPENLGGPGRDQEPTLPNKLRAQHTLQADWVSENTGAQGAHTRAFSPRLSPQHGRVREHFPETCGQRCSREKACVVQPQVCRRMCAVSGLPSLSSLSRAAWEQSLSGLDPRSERRPQYPDLQEGISDHRGGDLLYYKTHRAPEVPRCGLSTLSTFILQLFCFQTRL